MKTETKLFIVVILLIISNLLQRVEACQLSIPESYIPTFLSPPVSGHYQKCEEKPKEKCYCVEKVDPWTAEAVDNEVIDYVAWRQVESCKDELDCDDKFSRISCSEGQEIKNYEALSVYCSVNIMKIDGKKFVESPTKKDAIIKERVANDISREAKAAEKKAIIEELRAVKKSDLSANAKTADIVLKIIKRLEAIE